MGKFEGSIKKMVSKTYALRFAWGALALCALLLIGITTSALSSPLSLSQTSSVMLTLSSAPILGWAETTALPEPVAGKNAVAHDEDGDGNDDYIFFVGGRNSGGVPSTRVFVGAIGADGTIGGWTDTTPLPRPLFLHSLNATETHLVVIGGWKGSEPTQKEIYSAEILENGTLGAWNSGGDYDTGNLIDNGKVSQHGSTIVNDAFIYGIGGWEGSYAYSNVNVAPINADGTLGDWTPTRSLPTQRRRVAVATFNNRIYVTGGVDGSSNPRNEVYVGIVDTESGQVPQWIQLNSLPVAMFYHRAVVHDGNLVVMGGKSVNNGPDLKAVYSAPLNADGTIGAWQILPELPQGLFRFAAVSVKRWGSEYIVVMGGGQGLNANPDVRDNVYYSSLPATPTPTPTPTLTPTPTPPVSMEVSVSNDPGRWVAPGEEITYIIEYTNRGPGSASDTVVKGNIPEFTEYVNGSADPQESSLTSAVADGEISWSLGTIGSGESGRIEYQVRRVAPESGQQGAVEVGLVGPAVGTSGQPLSYTVQITNLVGGGLGETRVEVNLPSEATYLESSNGGSQQDDGSLVWIESELPEGGTLLNFSLSSNSSLVIHDYQVEAKVLGSDLIACCGTGVDVVVTEIDGLPVLGPGDGLSIVNDDVEISWNYNGGSTDKSVATRIQNPRLANDKLFLPYVTQ